MSDVKIPFRADHVGSFLRSAVWKDARAKHDNGEMTDAELAEIEDREIERIVAKQEEAGLKLATDGDYRRATWHNDFFKDLDGCEPHEAERGVQFKGIESTTKNYRVVGKIGFSNHPALDHFNFLAAHTRLTPKVTIPSPSVAHFRKGHEAVRHVYPDIQDYFTDLGEAYHDAVKAFYDAGCRYLQFDDTAWAHLGSDDERQRLRDRGEDPDEVADAYARMIDRALEARPDDMAITTHLCHGNFRSHWSSEGSYELVAERLLGEIDYDGYFLEYDTDRAGGFEPLRFLPKGHKRVVLGLVTSKSGALEPKDDLKRRIDEAAGYADIGQLCLSPQCGFASTEEGNELTEDEQWAKLRLVVDVATDVWGEA